jgi:hypothetical protein
MGEKNTPPPRSAALKAWKEHERGLDDATEVEDREEREGDAPSESERGDFDEKTPKGACS